MSPPSDLEKFIRWFVVPVSQARMLPRGDGAFVALSIGFTLFERFYRIRTNSQLEEAGDKFRNAAAFDLDVNIEFFTTFWSTYRNGLLHQGSPREYVRDKVAHKWLIDDSFDEFPTYFDDGGIRYICLNPWKFYDFIVNKIINDPASISGCLTYRLGNIYERLIAHKPLSVKFAEPYPKPP